MPGLGLSGFGSTIFGYGAPEASNPNAGNVLQITLGGQSQDARLIDPITRDYIIDDNGLLTGNNSISQQVYLAIVMTAGSSAVPAFGSQLSQIKTIDPSNIQARISNVIQVALQTMINNGLIRLISVQSNVSNDNQSLINITVNWTDLTTNTINTTVI